MRKDHLLFSPRYLLFILSAMSFVVFENWLSNRESGSAPLDTQKFLLSSLIGLLSYSISWAVRKAVSIGEDLKDSFLVSLTGTIIYTCLVFTLPNLFYLFQFFSTENFIAIAAGFILHTCVFTLLIALIYYASQSLLIKRFR